MSEPIAIVHLFACFAMTGLIWLVQLVVYPMFAYIDPAKWSAAHAMHSNQITLIVLPLMGLELLTAFYLVAVGDAPAGRGWMVVNLVGVLAIWGSTALVSVPIHNQLAAGGYDLAVIQQLVATNWIRTVLWSVRAVGWLAWLLISR